MAYPHSFGYNPFYKPDPSFHSPTSLLSFHNYIQPTIPSFMSYPLIWCHAPLLKIRRNGVTTKVGDVYMRGNTPRIHAKPKVT